MTTSKRIVSAAAIVGGLCGWLLLTKSGQRVRERMKKGRKLLSDLRALREPA